MYTDLYSKSVEYKQFDILISSGPRIENISCRYVSESFTGKINVNVGWNQSDGDSTAFYITTNAPQTPSGGLVNITTGSVTQHELTGFMAGYDYNITVCGICGGQVGKSEPLTITPQGMYICYTLNYILSPQICT